MERVLKENSSHESANAKRVTQGRFAPNSPQGDIASRINNSPHMIAQRKKLQSLFGGAAQLQGAEDELLQGKFNPIQRQGVEEEELLQGKFEPVQRVEDEEPLQGKFALQPSVQLKEEPAAKPNDTGLPDNLKSGIESLSGLSLDNVKVHYNSPQPAQLSALAYAQGSDIHVAPGQEQHLPHEAWHVVQQAQGRVQPTMQMKEGVPVNDDQRLEREADVMGAKALLEPSHPPYNRSVSSPPGPTIQRMEQRQGETFEMFKKRVARARPFVHAARDVITNGGAVDLRTPVRPGTAVNAMKFANSSSVPWTYLKLALTPQFLGGPTPQSLDRAEVLGTGIRDARENEFPVGAPDYRDNFIASERLEAQSAVLKVASIAASASVAAAPAAPALSMAASGATIASGISESFAGDALAARPVSPTGRGVAQADLHQINGERKGVVGVAGVTGIPGAGLVAGMVHDWWSAENRERANLALVEGQRKRKIMDLEDARLRAKGVEKGPRPHN